MKSALRNTLISFAKLNPGRPTKRISLCAGAIALCAASLPPAITLAQEAPLPNRPIARTGDPTIYNAVKGDTFEHVARKLLGSGDFASELRQYNRMPEGTLLEPGTSLVIPGRERDIALSQLWKAKDMRVASIEAGAEKYAAELLGQADVLFQTSSGAFHAADYDRAGVLGQRAFALYLDARGQCDLNALKDRLARVTHLSGTLQYTTDGGANWILVKEGDRIPVDSKLRSQKDSRAEIQMPDLSTFILDEESEVEFTTMSEDERTGKMDTQLEVSIGEIFGNIKPKKKESGSKFYIKNGRTTIVIRGTKIRTNRDESGLFRSMTLVGETELVNAGAANPLPLPGGFGTWARAGEPAHDPVPLLDAPTPLYPDVDVEKTPKQVIKFRWKKIRTFKLKYYKIEIAKDPGFIDMTYVTHTKDDTLTSPALPAGEYFWRISSVDRNGLQGTTSTPVKFLIEPVLDITLIPSKTPVEKDGFIWLPPNTTVTAAPVNPEQTSVTKIAYSVNNSAFKFYPKGVILKTGGEYHVSAIGEGATGNKGETFNRVYRVDAVGPTIAFEQEKITVDPLQGPVYALRLKTEDAAGMGPVQVSINGEAFKAYTGQMLLPADREHAVTAKAKDVFGNETTRRTIIEASKTEVPKPLFEPAQ